MMKIVGAFLFTMIAIGTFGLRESAHALLFHPFSPAALDKSFGDNGQVILDYNANAVAIQQDPDGAGFKIIVVGFKNEGFLAARYDDDGRIDQSFGKNGERITNIDKRASASDVIIQSDRKIVMGGRRFDKGFLSSDVSFALVRLTPDGNIDTSFDGDGKVVTGFGDFEVISTLAQQPDGKIVAAGTQLDEPLLHEDRSKLAIARYYSGDIHHPDGSLDATDFDGDGKVITTFGEGELSGYWRLGPRGLAIHPHGKIIAVGVPSADGEVSVGVAAYNNNGRLDWKNEEPFGVPYGEFSHNPASAVAIDSGGGILVGGEGLL
jgi:uncharacterized delta-60 repeat protein